MDRADLEMCWLPHATSKIHDEPDLQAIRTMGFRGEALSSIAAVSRLTVCSCTGAEGGALEVHGSQRQRLDAWAGRRGTRVEVANLFYNLPARLQFLKRAGSEFLLCKTTFIEKALSHPGVGFRLFNDGKLALFLPPRDGGQALKERWTDAYRAQLLLPAGLHQIAAAHPEAAVTLIFGRPDNYQHDRKLIQVFINRRRINEYSLQQAVEAGFTGFLPGGRFPVAAVHLEIDPARVDVNIHPAKREVKLMDGRRLHAIIVRMIQDFLRIDHHRRQVDLPSREPWPSAGLPGLDFPAAHQAPAAYDLRHRFTVPEEVREIPVPGRSGREWPDTGRQQAPVSPPAVRPATGDTGLGEAFPSNPAIRYIGQAFGVFLVAQKADELLLLDFHAAHERILFDRYRADRSQQRLLVPVVLHPADADEGSPALRRCQSALSERGVLVAENGGAWVLEAVPLCYSGDAGLLVEALEDGRLDLEQLDRRLFATLACRAARKDGDLVTAAQAQELLEAAMALPEKRCPHGRPIFFSLSREELFELVGRKV
jgi:DNA mismatch repair protein MutL